MNDLISLKEASQIYKCTERHLSFLCRCGKLRAERIGKKWFTTKECLDAYFRPITPAPPADFSASEHITNITSEAKNGSKFSFAFGKKSLLGAAIAFSVLILYFSFTLLPANFAKLPDQLASDFKNSFSFVDYYIEPFVLTASLSKDGLAMMAGATVDTAGMAFNKTYEFFAGLTLPEIRLPELALPEFHLPKFSFNFNPGTYLNSAANLPNQFLNDFKNSFSFVDYYIEPFVTTASLSKDGFSMMADATKNFSVRFSISVVVIISDAGDAVTEFFVKPAIFATRDFVLDSEAKFLSFGRMVRLAFEYKEPPQIREGLVVLPSGGIVSREAVIKFIKASFSDEVIVKPDEGGDSGVIQPIFKKGKGEEYIYVMVPAKNAQKVEEKNNGPGP